MRDVRLYLIGLGASVLGTSAMMLVAGIWVKTLTGSNRAAALVSACLYAPSLLAPAAGLVADRVPRRRLLLLINLVAAGGLLPLLLVHGRDRVSWIFVVMAGYGVVLVLVDPAETALFSELVPVRERGRINGLRLSLQEGAKLVAPLAGAALFAVLGGGAVAAVDALSFGVAAAAVALLRSPPAGPGSGTGTGPRPRRWTAELLAGTAHVWHTRALRGLAVVGAAAMALSGISVAPRYALLDALHRPPAFLGVLTALLGAGSILAGLAAGRLLRRSHEHRLAGLGLAAGVGDYLLYAAGAWLPAALLGSVVLGFFLPWIVIAVITAGQRLSPDRLQGRVAAALTFLLFAATPATQAAGALLLPVLGYRTMYLLSAGVALLLLGLLLRSGRPATAAGDGTPAEPSAAPAGLWTAD